MFRHLNLYPQAGTECMHQNPCKWTEPASGWCYEWDSFRKLLLAWVNHSGFPFPGFSGFLHEQAVRLRCLFGRRQGSDSAGERAASGYPARESKGDFLTPVWFQSGMSISSLPCLRFLWPKKQKKDHFVIILRRDQIARLSDPFTPERGLLTSPGGHYPRHWHLTLLCLVWGWVFWSSSNLAVVTNIKLATPSVDRSLLRFELAPPLP